MFHTANLSQLAVWGIVCVRQPCPGFLFLEQQWKQGPWFECAKAQGPDSFHSLGSFSVYPLVTDLLLLRLWLKCLYFAENGQVLSCGSNSFGQLGVPHGPGRCVVPQAIEVRTSPDMHLARVLLKNFQGITVIPPQTGWVPESWKTVFSGKNYLGGMKVVSGKKNTLC